MLNTPDAAGVFLLCLEKLRALCRLGYPCVAALVVRLAFLFFASYLAGRQIVTINEVLVLESSIYDRHIIMRK